MTVANLARAASPTSQRYRTGYLASRIWHLRRAEFLRTVRVPDGLRCRCCATPLTVRQCDVHHLDYTGVTRTGEAWVAAEKDDDLIEMCRACHEAVHHLLDAKGSWRTVDRRTATMRAMNLVRLALARQGLAHGQELNT